MQSKTDRQEKAFRAWASSPWDERRCGTFEAVTGFGKTRVGLMAIHNSPAHYHVITVVPSVPLKSQWEEQIPQWNSADRHVEVLTVQSMVRKKDGKHRRFECDLLIIDEVHRMGAQTFSRIFKLVTYKHVLGLTARFERHDKKMDVLEQYAPVFDRVIEMEAKVNQWVSDYIQINIPCVQTFEEQSVVRRLEVDFDRLFSYFQYDYDKVRACLKGEGIRKKITGRPGSYYRNRMAKLKGWRPEKGADHFWSPQSIQKHAAMFQITMRKRMDMLYNHPAKLRVLEKLFSQIPKTVKVIHFSRSIKFAEKAMELCGGMVYHSDLPTLIMQDGEVIGESVKVEVGKGRKKKTRTMYKLNITEDLYTYEELKDTVGKVQRVSAKRRKVDTLTRYVEMEGGVLHSVEALDEGVDVPGIQVGIISSGSSSQLQDIQRRGRTIRYQEGKQAWILNLYIPDSQDEKWLNRRQAASTGIIKAETPEDLIWDDGFAIRSRIKLN